MKMTAKLPVYEEELVSVIKSLGMRGTTAASDPTEELETGGHEDELPKAHAPSLPRTVTERNLFHHPDTHPLILDLALLRKYGAEWYMWEPETLEHVIPQDFRSSSVSHVNLAKINACKSLHLVDAFWERWEVFGWCAMSLNGVPPDFDLVQVPTVSQAAVAVDIAARIRTDVPWTEEVKKYLEQVLIHDGVLFAAPPLDFLEFCADEYPVDCADLDKRWPAVRLSGKAPTGNTIEDEQLRRLLLIENYLDENRARLRDQLELLKNV